MSFCLVLALKRIDYEYKTINLLKLSKGLDHASFGGVNPMNQVPVLEVIKDGKSDYLFQSLPIIEYIEESYPGTYSILPNDTLLRQRTRAMAELVNSGIQPLQNLAILGMTLRRQCSYGSCNKVLVTFLGP